MSITTKDIARICGVSRTTVSRALNSDTGSIKEETKKRILETAKKMGYQPNLVARSLVKGKSNTIGIVVPNLENYYFPKLIDAIALELKKNDYMLQITLHEDKEKSEIYLIQTLQNYRVDGLILHPISNRQKLEKVLSESDIPHIMLGQGVYLDSVSIGIDEKPCTIEAVRYIVKKGYRSLVFAYPVRGHEARLEGFLEQANKENCQYKLVEISENYKEEIFEMIQCSKERIGILCSGDAYAGELMFYLKEKGLKAGIHYGVMGYDRIEIYQNITPRLTTVENNVGLMGSQVAKTILAMIEGKDVPKVIDIPYHVVPGETL